jgi:hypothetical protein
MRGVSLDHLVGQCELRRRDGNPEHLCGSPIDDELDLGGLHHRQVAGRLSLEKARGANPHPTIGIAEVAPEGLLGASVGDGSFGLWLLSKEQRTQAGACFEGLG